ncbi:SRPBCC domain-containing protein [Exilibacterium tricleocarpae]|uniref:SRPBCC domain-containing protein n=1 Tax=Exilibacterium tricleocarpae TaxID=2591008 RepID=A0A545SYA5_9GAMM|nr:SRPBCC domain-containing protein [Exilibacterium tricleocarpae]TQV69919.1 SRPBCC domain-containing protein [Exilibacterium tricleocarpae]
MTEANETLHLRILRRFDVSPEVVFNAFTNPESMQIWWGKNTTFDINLSVGGRWTITRKEGETLYKATGEYLEIEKPHRLRYTYGMPQFSPNSDIISIDITPEGAGCVVTFVQTGEDIASELRELPPGSISASEDGWQQGFDLMVDAWGKSA